MILKNNRGLIEMFESISNMMDVESVFYIDLVMAIDAN